LKAEEMGPGANGWDIAVRNMEFHDKKIMVAAIKGLLEDSLNVGEDWEMPVVTYMGCCRDGVHIFGT
jgi:hypothetical protein